MDGVAAARRSSQYYCPSHTWKSNPNRQLRLQRWRKSTFEGIMLSITTGKSSLKSSKSKYMSIQSFSVVALSRNWQRKSHRTVCSPNSRAYLSIEEQQWQRAVIWPLICVMSVRWLGYIFLLMQTQPEIASPAQRPDRRVVSQKTTSNTHAYFIEGYDIPL